MDKHITRLVEMFFEEIPYSMEVMKAQERIRAALEREYQKLCRENAAHVAFEILLSRYGTLSDMAVLAGYSVEDAEGWRSAGKTTGIKPLRKKLTRQRRRAYLISLLWLFAGVYVVEVPLVWHWYPLLFAVIFGLTAFFVHKKYGKKEAALTADCQYDTEVYLFLRAFSDKYAKRTLNGVALLFAVAAVFLYLELHFLISGNSKPTEFLENIYTNIIVLEIPVYLCLKNVLCLGLAQRRINLPDKAVYRKHLRGITACSAAYWLLTGLLMFALKSGIRRPANVLLMAGALFALLILAYNLTLRKKITYKNIVVNGRKVALCTAAAVLVGGFSYMQKDTWYTQEYINAVPVVPHNEHDISYNEQTGVFTITSSTDDFKILHLTDIHLGGSLYSYHKDLKALHAVYTEIAHSRPDLVVVTGDLTFPLGIMSLSLNNSAPVNQFAAFMRNIDIPWVFTYGNHDTESLATMSKKELNDLYTLLSYKTSGNLLYPYVQPGITGRNNQLVEVRNSDGSLKQALFLIDSNAYTGDGINDYDYIHDDQVDWYAREVERLNQEEGHIIPSMVFFHIPLQEYRTAYELYEQGSDEVKYFFGENNEKMIDKVCCSDYPSKLFDTMVALGSTKAVFCGHDHYNNMSLEYKGIRLTYGMSIDYLAMPGIENDTGQRGAELITIHGDGSWELEQIPFTSIFP